MQEVALITPSKRRRVPDSDESPSPQSLKRIRVATETSTESPESGKKSINSYSKADSSPNGPPGAGSGKSSRPTRNASVTANQVIKDATSKPRRRRRRRTKGPRASEQRNDIIRDLRSEPSRETAGGRNLHTAYKDGMLMIVGRVPLMSPRSHGHSPDRSRHHFGTLKEGVTPGHLSPSLRTNGPSAPKAQDLGRTKRDSQTHSVPKGLPKSRKRSVSGDTALHDTSVRNGIRSFSENRDKPSASGTLKVEENEDETRYVKSLPGTLIGGSSSELKSSYDGRHLKSRSNPLEDDEASKGVSPDTLSRAADNDRDMRAQQNGIKSPDRRTAIVPSIIVRGDSEPAPMENDCSSPKKVKQEVLQRSRSAEPNLECTTHARSLSRVSESKFSGDGAMPGFRGESRGREFDIRNVSDTQQTEHKGDHNSRKQLLHVEESIPRTCPICQAPLENSSLSQFREHIETCIEKDDLVEQDRRGSSSQSSSECSTNAPIAETVEEINRRLARDKKLPGPYEDEESGDGSDSVQVTGGFRKLTDQMRFQEALRNPASLSIAELHMIAENVVDVLDCWQTEWIGLEQRVAYVENKHPRRPREPIDPAVFEEQKEKLYYSPRPGRAPKRSGGPSRESWTEVTEGRKVGGRELRHRRPNFKDLEDDDESGATEGRPRRGRPPNADRSLSVRGGRRRRKGRLGTEDEDLGLDDEDEDYLASNYEGSPLPQSRRGRRMGRPPGSGRRGRGGVGRSRVRSMMEQEDEEASDDELSDAGNEEPGTGESVRGARGRPPKSASQVRRGSASVGSGRRGKSLRRSNAMRLHWQKRKADKARAKAEAAEGAGAGGTGAEVGSTAAGASGASERAGDSRSGESETVRSTPQTPHRPPHLALEKPSVAGSGGEDTSGSPRSVKQRAPVLGRGVAKPRLESPLRASAFPGNTPGSAGSAKRGTLARTWSGTGSGGPNSPHLTEYERFQRLASGLDTMDRSGGRMRTGSGSGQGMGSGSGSGSGSGGGVEAGAGLRSGEPTTPSLTEYEKFQRLASGAATMSRTRERRRGGFEGASEERSPSRGEQSEQSEHSEEGEDDEQSETSKRGEGEGSENETSNRADEQGEKGQRSDRGDGEGSEEREFERPATNVIKSSTSQVDQSGEAQAEQAHISTQGPDEKLDRPDEREQPESASIGQIISSPSNTGRPQSDPDPREGVQ